MGIPGDTVQLSQGRVLVNGTLVQGTEATSRVDGGAWPEGPWVLREGEYFLLGDAGDESTDSRSFGPVPRKAIKGRAWLVYWPVSRWRRVHTT